MKPSCPAVARLCALVLTLLAGAVAPLAAQVTVPGDFTELQDALDAASPGDTIVIVGGEHRATVIDKPITLVGHDLARPRLRAPVFNWTSGFDQSPSVRLDGPGSGTVTLVNFVIDGTTHGAMFSKNAPAIGGGGFDALHVLRCDVSAPEWHDYDGFGNEVPGIDVDLPYLLVSRSTVLGGTPVDNYPWHVVPIDEGGAGIRSTGDVTIVDSIVRGGDALDTVWNTSQSPAPTSCAEVPGGHGGPAVVTPGDVYRGGSQLMPGDGASLSIFTDPVGTVYFCDIDDGPVYDVGGTITLLDANPLTATALLVPGEAWELEWSATAPNSVLLLGYEVAAPIQVGFKGLLFANPAALQLFPRPAVGPQTLSFVVPPLPGIEGLTVAIQRYSSAEGLSKPAFTSYVPG